MSKIRTVTFTLENTKQRGLIATEEIKSGEILGIFSWRYPNLKEFVGGDDTYLIVFDEDDQRIMTDKFRFINHSAINNNVVIFSSGEVQAIEDIKPNQFILSDYGEVFTDHYHGEILEIDKFYIGKTIVNPKIRLDKI